MNEYFGKLPHGVMDAILDNRTLHPIDAVHMLLLLRKFNGHNNGAISLGLREACTRCRCSKATSARALQRLQTAGLIGATAKGHTTPVGRPDIPTRWNINFIENQPKRHETKSVDNGKVIRFGSKVRK